jgi:hypothetical protein
MLRADCVNGLGCTSVMLTFTAQGNVRFAIILVRKFSLLIKLFQESNCSLQMERRVNKFNNVVIPNMESHV